METGTSLSAAFRKYPLYFDNLYCNLVEAGEAAGILEELLDRLAIYMEKTEAIKSKIKSALMYPISVVVVAFVVVAVIMIFVIPAFKEVFSSFGADLPAPTLFVIAHQRVLRQVLVADLRRHRRRLLLLHAGLEAQREGPDVHGPPACCKLPIFGDLIDKSVIARWTRTLSTMFAAGVPLVEALDSVGGASGNSVYADGHREDPAGSVHRHQPDGGHDQCQRVPHRWCCRCPPSARSPARIDHMLGKAADFYEAEVDDMVAGLSSLMEPIIIVFLGVLIGGIVVSMYLPIFKLGQVV